MKKKIIVALDFSDKESANCFVNRLSPDSCGVKVGKELFLIGGPSFVESLVAKGFSVFLDLKFHDIPNTVAKACVNASNMGIWMLNVHALGGKEMLVAARESIPRGQGNPLLIAVTILTSLDDSDLLELGFNEALNPLVNNLTRLAKISHYDGVVCSAKEAFEIRAIHGDDFLRITPGIRLAIDNRDEQKRVMTPADAVTNGASFLVIGRSITRSDKPMDVIASINKQISQIESRIT